MPAKRASPPAAAAPGPEDPAGRPCALSEVAAEPVHLPAIHFAGPDGHLGPVKPVEWTIEADGAKFWFTTDPTVLDAREIYSQLGISYWAERRTSFEQVFASWANAYIVLSVWRVEDIPGAGSTASAPRHLAGFMRLVSDGTTFAYLSDVWVTPSERGRGLGKEMLAGLDRFPEVKLWSNFILATGDAQTLYARYGWKSLHGGPDAGHYGVPLEWMNRKG